MSAPAAQGHSAEHPVPVRAVAIRVAGWIDRLGSVWVAGQLVELLRNEAATIDDRDPFEALMDFSGPTAPPEDPVLARLFPTAYPDDEEAAC